MPAPALKTVRTFLDVEAETSTEDGVVSENVVAVADVPCGS